MYLFYRSRAPTVMAAVNWSRKETFKLISLWSEDVIQQQLEGCRRNSSVFCKIADGLSKDGFTCTMEQCRDKIKKLKAEYKKIRDKRDTTGQGRYSLSSGTAGDTQASSVKERNINFAKEKPPLNCLIK